MDQAFPLAPMSRDLRVLTGLLLPLPVAFAAGAWFVPPLPTRPLLVAAGLIAVMYLAVWLLARPELFVVSEKGLTIRWPLYGRDILAAEMAAASIVDRDALRQAYGTGIRVGVGGLWGTFGLLLTPQATIATYISRTDRFVLVRRTDGRLLLITPAEPERFLTVLSNAYSLKG